MGKKSSPKTPPAPDYSAAATAQGQANIDAARVGAELTNTNQVTPYGSQIFTRSPDSDQWTSTVTLSPEQQQLYDLQTQGDVALGGMAVDQLGRINDSVSQPLDLSGAPARVSSVNQAGYSLYGGGAPSYQRVGGGPQYSDLGTGPTYDRFSGEIADLPDFNAQAQEVEDSLYRSATQRLDPEYARAEDALRTRLINSGISPDSEMGKFEMEQFGRQRQADYGNARDRAIVGRGAEQSRLNSDFFTGNAQRFGQQIQSQDFNNQASGREFSDSLSREAFNNTTQQQRFADILRSADFNNVASRQELDDTLRTLGFNNAAEGQRFSDSVAAGNFQNTQRGAAIDEAAYLRNDPLNLYTALASGSQVTNPQFRGTGQVATPGAAPTFAATQAADQRAIDLYNAQVASSGSARGGLYGMLGNLGGAAIGKWLGG